MLDAIEFGVVYHCWTVVETEEVDDERGEEYGVAFGAGVEIEPGEEVAREEGANIAYAFTVGETASDFIGGGVGGYGVEGEVAASLQLQPGSRA